MTFNAQQVVQDYGKHILGEAVVFFPAAKAKRLLVCFSAMDANNKFNRLSWFWREGRDWTDEAVLFVHDERYTYYLGDDAAPRYHTYEKLILHFMELSGLGRKDVFCVGSSMGGYGSLLFAARMNLGGAIVGVPQVAKRFARMHTYANWIKAMDSTGGQWLELDEYFRRPDILLPPIYLEYGRYAADQKAAEALIEIWRERGGTCISRFGRRPEHVYFMSRDVVVQAASYLHQLLALE